MPLSIVFRHACSNANILACILCLLPLLLSTSPSPPLPSCYHLYKMYKSVFGQRKPEKQDVRKLVPKGASDRVLIDRLCLGHDEQAWANV